MWQLKEINKQKRWYVSSKPLCYENKNIGEEQMSGGIAELCCGFCKSTNQLKVL